MDNPTLYWLAGLLEGEGSFVKPPPSDLKRPRISLTSSDRDITDKVATLFDVTPTPQKRRKAHWSPTFVTLVRGTKAINVMKRLYPLMGQRRQAQISNALNAINDSPIEPTHDFDNRYELYWLAGLLEGEGSFLKGPPSEPNIIRIQIQMADYDVLERVAAIFGVSVRGPHRPSKAKDYWKDRYTVAKRSSGAAEWMQRLRPLMSIRRQSQIDNALASYTDMSHGANHPQAKLTEADVRDIKRRIANGEKQFHLAREYRVDTGLIWQIKAGRIWQHVESD